MSGAHWNLWPVYYIEYNCEKVLKMFVTTLLLLYAFGLRKWYLNGLATIFEYVRDEIEAYKQKERQRSASECEEVDNVHVDFSKATHVDLCFESIKSVMSAIMEDEVLPRFEEEKLDYWNLMTRSSRNYEFISWKITLIWFGGLILRHCILFPVRLCVLIFGIVLLVISTSIVGYLKDGAVKRFINKVVSIMCFKILSNTVSADISFYNPENKPKNGICVANHTSPLDVVLMMCDNCYSSIGQSQGGILGIVQRALHRASPHIWFERSRASDRQEVTKRMKNHVSNPNNPPILIFPEGTCINNSAVMQFKKGAFELGSVIYPVAIKYDPAFGNAFWNSSIYSYMQYLFCMMTSWAIVCKVWYLPPMYQKEGESSIEFAERVKKVIAKQGQLADLTWDGQLKRSKPKKELLYEKQKQFSERLINSFTESKTL